jgi:hypothetical protein
MSLESSLESQKALALEIGKHYYKGFGNRLEGIMIFGEEHLLGFRYKSIKNAYETLHDLEKFYSGIPFESLHGKEVFYPLFVVKRLLPLLRQDMDAHFSAPTKNSLENLQKTVVSIADVGRLYFDSLMQTLDEIRSHPEAAEFRVKLIDYRRVEWNF